jgi:hypothetical protein
MSNDIPESNETGSASGGPPSSKYEELLLAVNALNATHESAESGRADHDRKILRWTRITGIGVAIYTALTAVIVIASIYSAKQSKDQLILTFPPKVLVTNVAVYPTKGKRGDPVNLSPGMEISGNAWIVNTGPGWTNLAANKFGGVPICMIYWRIGPLPMYRPYDVPDARAKNCGSLQYSEKAVTALQSGDIAYWAFETVAPDDYSPEMILWILGNIWHYDRADVRHLTLFARYYDLTERRFKAATNTDYENIE